jgi:hypothetical protein
MCLLPPHALKAYRGYNFTIKFYTLLVGFHPCQKNAENKSTAIYNGLSTVSKQYVNDTWMLTGCCYSKINNYVYVTLVQDNLHGM